MQIENKVFLVSGGASGLGAATAEMLVAAGAKVMLVDMNADAVAAKPFIGPALEQGRAEALEAMNDRLQADLAKAGKP